MSGPKQRRAAMADQQSDERADAVTDAALASIRASQVARRGEGEAVMMAAMTFGAAVEDGILGRAVALSRAFCIIAAGVIPVALFWTLVWPG